MPDYCPIYTQNNGEPESFRTLRPKEVVSDKKNDITSLKLNIT